MNKALVLDANFSQSGECLLPEKYENIKDHNLYLYIKYYLSSYRANNAKAKGRGEVSGGGRKPWNQKGGGRARAGSITSPVFVGGGVSHGPDNNRNYNIKINKKQKLLALQCALNHKAKSLNLYVIDKIEVTSGKTKDAFKIFNSLNHRSVLFVTKIYDEKTYLAFRNIPNCDIVSYVDLNAYLITAYKSVLIEKEVFNEIVERG